MRLTESRSAQAIISLTHSRLFLPAIGLIIALNLVWLYSNLSAVKDRWRSPLTNGDRLPSIEGRGIANESQMRIDAESWRLVIYCSEESPFDIAKAKYADVLAKKYRDRNFSAIGIITEDCPKLKGLAKQRDVSYPMIVDENRTIAYKLGLRNRSHAVFVADPGGVIQFVATVPHIQEEDLRQLVEKFVLGKVTYMDDPGGQEIVEGKPFPQLMLEDLRSGETLSLNEQVMQVYNTYAVFTADCPACSLGSYLGSFQFLMKSLEAKGQRAMAIFSSRFSREQLLEEVRARQITAPLYLARAELSGFEDAYYLRSFTSQVVVLTVDTRGVISKVQPIHEYMDMLKAQEAGK